MFYEINESLTINSTVCSRLTQNAVLKLLLLLLLLLLLQCAVASGTANTTG